MTTTTKWPHHHFVPQPGENAGLRPSLHVGLAWSSSYQNTILTKSGIIVVFVFQPGENAGLRPSLHIGPARGAWRDGQMLYGNLRGEQRSKQTIKRNKRGETKPDQEQKNIYADKRLLCRCTARGRVRAAPHHQVPLKVDQKLWLDQQCQVKSPGISSHHQVRVLESWEKRTVRHQLASWRRLILPESRCKRWAVMRSSSKLFNHRYHHHRRRHYHRLHKRLAMEE